jgi:hypothetical protein
LRIIAEQQHHFSGGVVLKVFEDFFGVGSAAGSEYGDASFHRRKER